MGLISRRSADNESVREPLREKTGDSWRHVFVARLISEKRANIGKFPALARLRQRQALVCRDAAIDRLFVASPNNYRFFASADRGRRLFGGESGVDLRGPFGEIQKRKARMEFEAQMRPILSANRRQGADRKRRGVG